MIEFLGRGNSWMDAGSWDTFHECSTFVKALQNTIKTKTPEIKKYQGEVEYLFTLGKAVNKIATAPKNSEEFVDMVLGTIRIDDVTDDFCDGGHN